MKDFYLKCGTKLANFPWDSDLPKKDEEGCCFQSVHVQFCWKASVFVLLVANKSKDLPPTLS